MRPHDSQETNVIDALLSDYGFRAGPADVLIKGTPAGEVAAYQAASPGWFHLLVPTGDVPAVLARYRDRLETFDLDQQMQVKSLAELAKSDPLLLAFVLLNQAVHAGNTEPWVIQARNILRWRCCQRAPESGEPVESDVSAHILREALLQVGVDRSVGEIDDWTPAQREATYNWAAAMHLAARSGEVEVPPLPAVLGIDAVI